MALFTELHCRAGKKNFEKGIFVLAEKKRLLFLPPQRKKDR